MLIRAEQSADQGAIESILLSAFDGPAEARLVAALRQQVGPLVSLVAEQEGVAVGHILFSPVTLPGRPSLKLMGLAPMAVTPDRQRKGIGSALVRAGLECCAELGVGAVAVLGHAGYYPRFGFVPASQFGIGCEYPVPDEVFMALELQPGYLSEAAGTVRYAAPFTAL
ncbi:GNAT family N-acetyltransferase [Marinobacterium arenosum]|uniref:GNAT family N-acetyltransferase n=1 Tax=Marinobacterium arenosum TaxID=2862496 RepID=UPI001C975DBA|nr:N-acetyltransferase [Marinobacterium arenosum]MBY4678424.1 N-acetyltransferase [Marinobacterium arenosum]